MSVKISSILLGVLVFVTGWNIGFFSREHLDKNDNTSINNPERVAEPSTVTAVEDLDIELLNSTAVSDQVAELAVLLKSEISRREELETQIANIELQMALIDASSQQLDEEITETREGTESVPSPVRQAGIQTDSLIRAGVDSGTVEELVAYWNQYQLEQLELRDTAAREGWLGSEEFREQARALSENQKNLRDEIGDDKYDRYLYESGQNNRVAIDSVIRGSVAENAGLRSGDIILGYADNRTFTSRELQNATRDGARGETVNVEVYRNGDSFQISVPRGPLGIMLDAQRVEPR